MSVVEDVRSALQDFVAPELRELRARVDALEEQQKQFRTDVEKRFDKVDKSFDTVGARFEKLEDNVNNRFDTVAARFEKLEDKLADRHEQLVTEIRRTADFGYKLLKIGRAHV